jgi:predicted dehydrogenase
VRKIKIAVVGAGNRGSIYGVLASIYSEFEVVAVAEPIKARREKFAAIHKLEAVFETWEDMLNSDISCDVVFVMTQDRQHFKPTMAALDKGFHVVVEKPLSPSYLECLQMVAKAKKSNRLLMLCYVLRYTPFFTKIKELINRKEIGDVRHISIDMNVAYWHQAHSFVRGNWGNAVASSPMILAKSCHDLDMFSFLLKKEPLKISSFGDRSYFKQENAPIGSSKRCLDGCEIEKHCVYSARKLYLGENTDWPVSTICDDLTYESRKLAIEHGPYGRCVYHCDNDVVEHQVVNILYEKGTTATLTMSGFTNDLTRNVRVLGTKGEITGDMNKHELYVTRFGESRERFPLTISKSGMHAGGDDGMMKAVSNMIRNQHAIELDHYYDDLIKSHYLAEQAERSRFTNRMIELDQSKLQLNI